MCLTILLLGYQHPDSDWRFKPFPSWRHCCSYPVSQHQPKGSADEVPLCRSRKTRALQPGSYLDMAWEGKLQKRSRQSRLLNSISTFLHSWRKPLELVASSVSCQTNTPYSRRITIVFTLFHHFPNPTVQVLYEMYMNIFLLLSFFVFMQVLIGTLQFLIVQQRLFLPDRYLSPRRLHRAPPEEQKDCTLFSYKAVSQTYFILWTGQSYFSPDPLDGHVGNSAGSLGSGLSLCQSWENDWSLCILINLSTLPKVWMLECLLRSDPFFRIISKQLGHEIHALLSQVREMAAQSAVSVSGGCNAFGMW